MKRAAIYIFHNRLQIATGKLHKGILFVEKCFTVTIDSGIFLNGVITNEQKAKDLLTELGLRWSIEKRQTHLIIDSGMIAVKRVEMPRLSKKHLLLLTKKELQEITTNYKMPIYDYAIIKEPNSNNKRCLLLSAAMEQSIISGYKHLFHNCHISLKSLDIAIMAQIRLAEFMPELRGKTFLMAVLDGRTILSSLFVSGIYTYTKRTQIEEESSNGLEKELQTAWLSLLQFCQTQEYNIGVREVYVSGFQKATSSKLNELGEILNISVNWLETSSKMEGFEYTDGDLSNCLYAIGNLLRR